MASFLLLLCQAGALACVFVTAIWSAALSLPVSIITVVLRSILPFTNSGSDGSAVFYEGRVFHARKQPAEHKFRSTDVEEQEMFQSLRANG